MTDVFLHVGLAKTGTTTIQAALEASAGRLASDGVLFPGGSHRAQRLAAYDLLGQRVRGEDGRGLAGSLRRLVEVVAAHAGRPSWCRRRSSPWPGHGRYAAWSARSTGTGCSW